jgi:hypothetical protein
LFFGIPIGRPLLNIGLAAALRKAPRAAGRFYGKAMLATYLRRAVFSTSNAFRLPLLTARN